MHENESLCLVHKCPLWSLPARRCARGGTTATGGAGHGRRGCGSRTSSTLRMSSYPSTRHQVTIMCSALHYAAPSHCAALRRATLHCAPHCTPLRTTLRSVPHCAPCRTTLRSACMVLIALRAFSLSEAGSGWGQSVVAG